MRHNLRCLICGRPAHVARELTELIRIHALIPEGTLGALHIEFPGEIQSMGFRCSMCAAVEEIIHTRKERAMPVPTFETLDDAAKFVVQHHRLPAILSVQQ